MLRKAAWPAGTSLSGQARAAIALAVVSPNPNSPTWVGWVGVGQWGEAEHPVGSIFFCRPLGLCLYYVCFDEFFFRFVTLFFVGASIITIRGTNLEMTISFLFVPFWFLGVVISLFGPDYFHTSESVQSGRFLADKAAASPARG